MQIEFIKVPAHSGVQFNEEVDAIAKNALLAKGHKTYNDGSVYFVGYSVQDWQTIIQCINDENAGLSEGEEISPLVLTKETIGTREKLRLPRQIMRLSLTVIRIRSLMCKENKQYCSKKLFQLQFGSLGTSKL